MRAVFICGAADHGALSTSEGLGVQFGGFWAPMKSASEEAKLAAAAPRDGVLDLTGTGVSDDELVAVLADAQLGTVGGVHTLLLAGCPISDRGVRIALLPLLDEARYLRCIDVTGCAHIGATVEAELLADFPLDRGVAMLAAGTALSIRAVERLANDTRDARRAQAALVLTLTLAAATEAAVAVCTGAARAAADAAAAATRAGQRASRSARECTRNAAAAAAHVAGAAAAAAQALRKPMDLAVAIVLSSNAAKRTVARDHQSVRVGRACVDACAIARSATEHACAVCEDADLMLRKLKVKQRRRKSVTSLGRKLSTIKIFEDAWKEELDVKMRRWMGDRYPYIGTSFSKGEITLKAPLEFLKNSATPMDPEVFSEVRSDAARNRARATLCSVAQL